MIIGISGKQGSGKNTFAELLQNELKEYNFVTAAFADAIKRGISTMFHIDLSDLYDQTKKAENTFCNMTYRKLFQTLGTDWGRNAISPDVWIHALESNYDTNNYNIIVCDVRFRNEAMWIKEIKNGIIIRINSDRSKTSTHVSEKDLDNYPFDISITNNHDETIDDLKLKAKFIASYIIEKYGESLNIH